MKSACALWLLAAILRPSAGAEAADLSAPYARALRAFDPGLSARLSRRLAARALTEADAYGLDARLVVALIAVESGWDPRAVSPAGALGLGQLMPGTARELGIDPADPEANVHGAVRYLRLLLDRYRGFPAQVRFERALGAYNAGPAAVDRYGGVPPFAQTQAYVRAVIALWRRLAGR